MKTFQKDGVRDRPPTPMTCPDMRHHSSAATVSASSTQMDAVQTSSDARVAPTPLPADAAHYVNAIVVDGDATATNGYLSHRTSSVHWLTTWTSSASLPRKG